MPNVKDRPGFETFSADVQQARKAVNMSCRELDEKAGIGRAILRILSCTARFQACRLWCSSSAFASRPQNATLAPIRFGRTVISAGGQATNDSFAQRSLCPLWKVSLTEPSN